MTDSRDKNPGSANKKHILAGFGFGPIQAGLFAKEARQSGNFAEIAIAEIDSSLVNAVRSNNNCYAVNIAHRDGIESCLVENVLLLDPNNAGDLSQLKSALARSTEIVTSLPSVNHYTDDGSPVVRLIAEGLQSDNAKQTIIYTAENSNCAAESLSESVSDFKCAGIRPHQYLNTVIGKMSRVVTDHDEIVQLDLSPIAPGFPNAFLVEEFNHILVTSNSLVGFTPGIEVFEEKDDLLPFAEAKLFGHNAIHALMAFLGWKQGAAFMSELANMDDIMTIARNAFLKESGEALIRKYGRETDPLFTPDGYRHFADDLLERMTNPYLADTVARTARDPLRKMGFNDRIFGTIRLAFEQSVEPVNMAKGAIAGLSRICSDKTTLNTPEHLRFSPEHVFTKEEIQTTLAWLWNSEQIVANVPHIVALLEAAQNF